MSYVYPGVFTDTRGQTWLEIGDWRVLTLDTTDSLGGYIIKHDDGNYDFDIFFLR